MAVTYTRVPDGNDVWGRTLIKIVDITLDSSYPLTNGYVIQASDVGMKGLFGAKVIGGNKASGAVLPAIDLGTVAGAPPTSAILRLFLPTGGGTAPATLTAPVGGTAGALTVAAGATPVTSTAANGAGIVTQAAGGAFVAGIGKEVGNTTDVSSIIVRVLFIGR